MIKEKNKKGKIVCDYLMSTKKRKKNKKEKIVGDYFMSMKK